MKLFYVPYGILSVLGKITFLEGMYIMENRILLFPIVYSLFGKTALIAGLIQTLI